jgi:hypothetical protein
MDPAALPLEAQLKLERDANRALAQRLHALRAALAPRLEGLLQQEAELLAWRRVAASLARGGCGSGLCEALRSEAQLQEAVAGSYPASDGGFGFLTTPALFSFAATSLGLPVAAPAPMALPPPCPRLPAPLIDCFLVCGPSHASVLGLWRTPGFLRHLGQPERSSHFRLSNFLDPASAYPSATLPGDLLFSYPSDAALPAEPSALAAFCLPEGAAVCGVPIPSLAEKLRGSPSTPSAPGGLAWGRGALDCLFEKAPGQSRGPRSHTFFLSGSLREEDATPRGETAAAASQGATGQARTRYCLCLAVSATQTLDMARGLAAAAGGTGSTGGTGSPQLRPPGGADSEESAPFYALSAPLVFCVVSRLPFFPAHFFLLRALAAQWRSQVEARVRQLAAAGHCDSILRYSHPQAAPQEAPPPGEGGGENGGEAERDEGGGGEPPHVLAASSSSSSSTSTSSFTSAAARGWGAMFSGNAGEKGGAPRRASFWGNFSIGGVAASSTSSRRPSATASGAGVGMGSSAGASASEVVRSEDAAVASTATAGIDTSPLISEDEVAFLSARLARHTFPEPLLATLKEYASLPVPAFGETLAWKHGLHALSFARPPLPPAAVAASAPPHTAPVGLRDAECRSALISWALPVLISLLPSDSLLLLLGAALTEHRIVFVAGGLSLEALSACVMGFQLLLSPLHWEGLVLPILPRALLDVLAAPVPFIVGLRALPSDFTQDDETIVVLLDCETLRIPASSIPSGVFGGGPEDRTTNPAAAPAAPSSLEPHQPPLPDFLGMLLPGASALFSQLEPLAALLKGAYPPPSTLTAPPAPPAPAPAAASGSALSPTSTFRARKPCYSPTPHQGDAAARLASCLEEHIAGLVVRAVSTPAAAAAAAGSGGGGGGGSALEGGLEAFPEVERQFWERFLGTQMLACHVDARQCKAAAEEVRATAAKAQATLGEFCGGSGGGGGGARRHHSPPNSSSGGGVPAAPPAPLAGAQGIPVKSASTATAATAAAAAGEAPSVGVSPYYHLPFVPPPPLAFAGPMGGGGAAQALAPASSPSRRAVGAAWRTAAGFVPSKQASVVALRSRTYKGE